MRLLLGLPTVWHGIHGVPFWPPLIPLLIVFPEKLVLSFLSFLMSASYSYSYIMKTLAGVSFFRHLHRESSCMQFFYSEMCFEGLSKASYVC